MTDHAEVMRCPECARECAAALSYCVECGAMLAADSAASMGSCATQLRGSDVPVAVAGGGRVEIEVGGRGRDTEVVSTQRLGHVLGSYRLLEVLGEGGMGVVYLAEHVKLGRKVALKMLHPHYANAPDVVRRFFAEARAVNTIFHDNIVEITDFVENEAGHNYFIMEYLKGTHLGEVIDREGPIPLARSLGISVQVCSALAAVHQAGIVHRDLKPDNIFITERGGQADFVKVLDFGIAKLLDVDGHTVPLKTTAAGVVMGTPEYMSPEQACGKPVDFRTDIYSLGIILYELCTGRKPFSADNFGELVVAHTTQMATPPRRITGLMQEIPRPLDELIMACLAKDPAERPAAHEIEARLRDIAESYAVELERFDVSPTMSRRTKLIAGLAAGGAVAAAAAFALVAMLGGDRADVAPPPVMARSAAAPPPAPPPVPTPELVMISLQSTPEGAAVHEVGVAEPVGHTPLVLELPKADEARVFEFRMAGYEPVAQRVSLVRDAQVAVALATSARADPESPRVSTSRAERRRRDRARRPGRRVSSKDAPPAVKPATTTAAKPSKPTPTPRRSGRIQEGTVLDPFAE